MRIKILVSLLVLSAASVAQADTTPAVPELTKVTKAPAPTAPVGGEICTIEVDGQDSFEVELTCEGLESCATDKAVAMSLAADCYSKKDVVEAVKKGDPNVARKTKKPAKKKPAKKPVKKKVVKKPSKSPPTLRRFNKEPVGMACMGGGISVHEGSDTNRNGKLEQSEVETLFYACNGLSGSDGLDGKDGKDGKDGVTTVKHVYQTPPKVKNGRDGSRINLGLGVIASALFSDDNPNAYAVGPSLQLQVSLAPKWELTLEGGWAMGHDRATMLHLGVARYLKSWMFIEMGPYVEWIGQSGNYAKAQFVGIAKGGGIRLTKGNFSLRASVQGFVGVEGFNLDNKTTVTTGATANSVLTYRW